MDKKIRISLFMMMFSMLAISITAFPSFLDQQGILRNVTTGALINRTETFNITIYNLSNNAILYTEQKDLSVLNGVWNYPIGYIEDIVPSMFFASTYFKTKVGTEVLSQINFTAVPYSFYSLNCNDSDYLGGLPSSSYSDTNDTITVNALVIDNQTLYNKISSLPNLSIVQIKSNLGNFSNFTSGSNISRSGDTISITVSSLKSYFDTLYGATGGGAGDKWLDGGTYIFPNSTFADNVIIFGTINATDIQLNSETVCTATNGYCNQSTITIATLASSMVANISSENITQTAYTNTKVTNLNAAINANISASDARTDGKINANITSANTRTDANINANISAENITQTSYTNTKVTNINGAITANISSENTTMKAYLISVNTSMTSFVIWVNGSMKNYVDAQVSYDDTWINSTIAVANSSLKGYIDTKVTNLNSAITANISAENTTQTSYTNTKVTNLNAAITANISAENTTMKAYLISVNTSMTSFVIWVNGSMKNYVDNTIGTTYTNSSFDLSQIPNTGTMNIRKNNIFNISNIYFGSADSLYLEHYLAFSTDSTNDEWIKWDNVSTDFHISDSLILDENLNVNNKFNVTSGNVVTTGNITIQDSNKFCFANSSHPCARYVMANSSHIVIQG